jgi:hypothetical protein
MATLPQNVLEIINMAVQQAVKQTKEELKATAPPAAEPERDYFKIMENLLYSYPTLKRIVSDKAAYTKVELKERSKSVVGFNYNATRKSHDDIIDELERDKEEEFGKTLKDFRRIERVILQFKDRKEFDVIRIYYFGESKVGTQKPEGSPAVTWDDVSFELEKDVKTLRRWRANLVNDMAICLFGIEAAVQAGTIRNT